MKHFAIKTARKRAVHTEHQSAFQPSKSEQAQNHEAGTEAQPLLEQPSSSYILGLQRTIGNTAVQRLMHQASSSSAPAIQRRLTFTSTQLGGKNKSSMLGKIKDNPKFSTFRRIQELLDKYHTTGPNDIDAQYDLVTEIVVICNKWLGDTDHLNLSDEAKRTDIESLKTQATAEKANLYVAQKIGLPLELIEALAPADFRGLYNTVSLLEARDVNGGMAAFTAVKPNLGPGAALIEAFIKRNYIALIDPGMAAIMNDDKYDQINTNQSGGATAIATMKSTAQAKLDRLIELQKQHDTAVGALTASQGAKKQADYPILDGVSAIAIEFGKLRQQKTQYESIVDGSAATDKRKKSAFGKFSEAEMTGLVGYTSDLYSAVNSPLRKDLGTGAMQGGNRALIGSTVSGLNKLKPYKGIVYRHADDFTGYAETHRPGAVVSDTAFLSTAKEQKGCASAAENHGVLEILISKTGRDVSEASVFGNKEAEILFRPGTRFTVTHVIERQKQHWDTKHNSAHWTPQNSPKFAEAMSLIGKEGALTDGFRRVVYKVEV